jgi:hypothetical protein
MATRALTLTALVVLLAAACFEVFNVLNHATFSAPNLTPTSGSFGLISAQANIPRSVQLGLRFVF